MQEFRPASVVAADTELAARLRAGDELAIRELYERYGGLVFTVARRVVGDRDRADDVTQQAFVKAWEHRDRFEPGRDFAPWLATIARRAAIDRLRYDQRRPTSSREVADPGDGALTADEPDAAALERAWMVRSAIDALDPAEREVVQLQHVEGCSHQEIADRLGVAVGTVKSRSFRAHRRLARRLEHLRDDEVAS